MKKVLLAIMLQTVSIFASAQFRGNVVSFEGKPIAGANIQIVKDNGPHSNSSHTTVCDEDGNFTFAGVEAGDYRVYAWKDSAGIPFTRYLLFRPDQPELRVSFSEEAPIQNKRIALPPPYGTVTGTVTEDISSKSVPYARIRLELASDKDVYFETTSESDGTFLIRLPPKPILLSVSKAGYSAWTYSSNLFVKTGGKIDLNIAIHRSLDRQRAFIQGSNH